jgi:hypothetical protein
MDTATQINKLLLQLDIAALRITNAAHPDVELHLDINCAVPGACGIVECDVETAHTCGSCLDLTVMPVRSHCATCGVIFAVAPGTEDLHCPACR